MNGIFARNGSSQRYRTLKNTVQVEDFKALVIYPILITALGLPKCKT